MFIPSEAAESVFQNQSDPINYHFFKRKVDIPATTLSWADVLGSNPSTAPHAAPHNEAVIDKTSPVCIQRPDPAKAQTYASRLVAGILPNGPGDRGSRDGSIAHDSDSPRTCGLQTRCVGDIRLTKYLEVRRCKKGQER